MSTQLEFLNLDDVDVNEADFIRNVLITRSPTVELPWTDSDEPLSAAEWPQQPQQYDGQPSGVVDSGGREVIYRMPVPGATTIQQQQQQMYHTQVVQAMPNVTYVSGIPPHPNYHPGLQQPPVPPYGPGAQQMYPQPVRPRSSKPSPKRVASGGGGSTTGAYPPNVPPTAYGPPPPSYPPPPMLQFPCISGTPTYPTAQHATGPPLYIQPMTMYHHPHAHPQPIYNYHGPMYSPISQPPPDEMKQVEFVETPVVKVEPTSPAVPQHNTVYMGPKPPRAQPRPQLASEETMTSVVSPSSVTPPSPVAIPSNTEEIVSPPRQHRFTLDVQEPPVKIEKSSPEHPAPPQAVNVNTTVDAVQPINQTSDRCSPAPTAAIPTPGASVKTSQPPSKDAIIITTLPPAIRKVPQAPVHEEPISTTPQVLQQPPAAVAQHSSPPQLSTASPLSTDTPEEQPSLKTESWASRLFKSSSSGLNLSDAGSTERRTFNPPQNAMIVSAPPAGSVSAKTSSQYHVESVRQADGAASPALKALGKKLSEYKLEHKAIILKPRGLTNPSNYCYINATLQALIACPAFYNLIKMISDVKFAFNKEANVESKTPIIDSMVHFVREFQQSPQSWFKRVDKAQARRDSAETEIMTDPPFEPASIHKVLRNKLRSETSFHEEGRQEDAEEFLSFLLNGLNDEMLELLKLVSDEKTPVINGEVTANGDSHIGDESLWKEVTCKSGKGSRITRRAVLERTPLSDIFRGQLRSRILRGPAEESTDNVQPFFTLQLDIESSTTVNEALEKLVEGTYIEDDSSRFRQQQTLDALPCVLILHLKCFNYTQRVVSKVKKALTFPVDLKLEPKLLSMKSSTLPKQRNYKLFAVVYHDGLEATKGHYLADVFHLGNSAWIRYDDAIVKLVKEEQVLEPRPPRMPYLLYYRRADTMGNNPRPT